MTETWRNKLMVKLQWTAAMCSYGLVNYRHPLRARTLNAVKDSCRRTFTSTTPMECAEIYNAVLSCEKTPGDMAEAGVYLGGTARLILSTSTSKRLHLFDTFAGLPFGEGDFEAGEWKGSIAEVRRNLSEFSSRLEFHQGYFPDSAAGLEDLRFSFVHLDLDLYQSTLSALEWFWPRMNPGAVLLSHDYPLSDGVVKAFHEFFAVRAEPFIALSGNQCVAVKA
jgi:O-methyltransferase